MLLLYDHTRLKVGWPCGCGVVAATAAVQAIIVFIFFLEGMPPEVKKKGILVDCVLETRHRSRRDRL